MAPSGIQDASKNRWEGSRAPLARWANLARARPRLKKPRANFFIARQFRRRSLSSRRMTPHAAARQRGATPPAPPEVSHKPVATPPAPSEVLRKPVGHLPRRQRSSANLRDTSRAVRGPPQTRGTSLAPPEVPHNPVGHLPRRQRSPTNPRDISRAARGLPQTRGTSPAPSSGLSRLTNVGAPAPTLLRQRVTMRRWSSMRSLTRCMPRLRKNFPEP